VIQRAFVLQLSSDWNPGDPLAGRVEHVTSGKAARFQNLTELADFADRIMRENASDDDEQEQPEFPSEPRP
jgi:hypothetical protein